MVKAPSSTDVLAMGPYCPSCQSSLGVPTIQPAPFYGADSRSGSASATSRGPPPMVRAMYCRSPAR